jgi:hypothetical protein
MAYSSTCVLIYAHANVYMVRIGDQRAQLIKPGVGPDLHSTHMWQHTWFNEQRGRASLSLAEVSVGGYRQEALPALWAFPRKFSGGEELSFSLAATGPCQAHIYPAELSFLGDIPVLALP